MRAIVRHRYGSPAVLALEEVEQPPVADDAALVRVRAASVNAYDWHVLRGLPYITRLSEGVRRPRDGAMGLDAAGVVEAVGPAVTHVRPGDEVFGSSTGAFAEFMSGRNFVHKPANLTFEEAAAVPVAGTTALQAISDEARVRPGQRVLVTGAGGGVGTFAVQIAVAFGAEVTAVTSTAKVETVRSIGAHHVVDRAREDVTRMGRRYDVVVDVAGYRRLRELRRVVARGGTLVVVGPGGGNWVGPVLHVVAARVRSLLGREHFLPFLARVNRRDLLVLRELIETGRVRPVIDTTYPLADAAKAVRRLESGRAAGKVVLTI